MSDITDHDIIIALDVKVDILCKKFDKLDEKIDEKSETHVTRKLFYWLNGIIIAGVLILVLIIERRIKNE